MNRGAHWDRVYATTAATDVSWYLPEPARSIELIRRAGAGPETQLIDIGGGASTFVDAVLAAGLGHVTVLDVSATALALARERLGARAAEVSWIEADVLSAPLPVQGFDVWHDRAVFHFLTRPAERARYAEAASLAVRSGGALVIAAFAPGGPERCSGLPVAHHTAQDLGRDLGEGFVLREACREVHRTPSGTEQRFTYARFERR